MSVRVPEVNGGLSGSLEALGQNIVVEGGGDGGCGVSDNEYTCAHHVTWSPPYY